MGNHFERGLLLFRQQRWDAAISEFQQELAQDPECSRSRSLMALCLQEDERYDPALELAREAVGKAPEDAFAHYVVASVLHHRDELAQAHAAIEEALRLDPEDASFWGRRAAILVDQGKRKDAVESAEHGLRLDPENTTCQNVRSLALVRLGRKAEARQGIEEALRRDPENPTTHANRGWTLLQESRPREALASFHEALRLDPANDWAREGMLEALRARYLAYRLLFGFQVWLAHLPPRARWAVTLGGYFGAKVLARIARSQPALLPWFAPILVAYALLVLFSWIGRPLSNTFLLLHRTARLSLGHGERVVASILGGVLIGSVLLLLVGLILHDERWCFIAGGALCLILPIAAIPLEAPPWRRGLMIGCAAGLSLLVVVLGALSFTSSTRSPLAAAGAALALVGGMLTTWLATGLLALRERRSRRA